MILSELQEITVIDSEIVELHEKLETLYQKRARLAKSKKSSTSSLASWIHDDINLEGIDLSLQ